MVVRLPVLDCNVMWNSPIPQERVFLPSIPLTEISFALKFFNCLASLTMTRLAPVSIMMSRLSVSAMKMRGLLFSFDVGGGVEDVLMWHGYLLPLVHVLAGFCLLALSRIDLCIFLVMIDQEMLLLE